MKDIKIDELAEVEKAFRLKYVQSICDLQLTYARRRNSPENSTRLQKWIHSTFQKDAFAWAMVHAAAVKLPASQSEIMAQTKITRQSISVMVQDCLAEGWIEAFCDGKKVDAKHLKHCKGMIKYWAGEEMMQLVDAFVERHIETTEGTFMNKHWDDLMAIRQVRRSGLK